MLRLGKDGDGGGRGGRESRVGKAIEAGLGTSALAMALVMVMVIRGD